MQDFTPCSAAAFRRQRDACTYLVGDARQRIYRWSGACETLHNIHAAREFRLSETWRFGPEIASAINIMLGCTYGDQRVVSRGARGRVVRPSQGASSLRSDRPLMIVTLLLVLAAARQYPALELNFPTALDARKTRAALLKAPRRSGV